MTFGQAKKELVRKFEKYGVTEEMVVSSLKDGIKDFDMNIRGTYNVARMAWADAIKKNLGMEMHEYFTVEDVMSITGETREECIRRIEEMLESVKESGGNPDDYAIKIKPSVFYFPNGLK